jgi:hypothetical protein
LGTTLMASPLCCFGYSTSTALCSLNLTTAPCVHLNQPFREPPCLCCWTCLPSATTALGPSRT